MKKELAKVEVGIQFRILILQIVNLYSSISYRDLLEKLSNCWPCPAKYFDLSVVVICEMSGCFKFFMEDDKMMLKINQFGKSFIDARQEILKSIRQD
ncbi:MAG: hypothetical protein ABIJ28_00050 [Patescibacteria group bacterium]